MEWLETAGVLGLALMGALLGLAFHQMRAPFWMLGYFLPLLLIVAIGLSRRFPALEALPPFSWLMAGRTEFAMTSFLTTMILFTVIRRLPQRRSQWALMVLMALIVGSTSLPVFLAPAFNRDYLRSLENRYDLFGICRQSNDYNCGPAAAVTALEALGFEAREGEIALLARTTRFTGTEPDVLAEALRKRYGSEGLKARYRHFRSIDELKGRFLTLARIKYGLLVDHYVTVLRVTDEEVIVADPSAGLVRSSREAFAARWRYTGVVLSGSPERAAP